MATLVSELGARVVPGCDADIVRRVFDVASAGFGGARRPRSWLTSSGVPFEASVVGGGGRPDRALRYVTEAGTAVPFFAARLAAQRRALDELIGWLPEPARSRGTADLSRFVDTLFPDPGAVPARTTFATSVGVVHREDQPGCLARLKVYGNVGADPDALARVAAVWPAFGEMAAAFEPGPDVRYHFASLELDAGGDLICKLYVGGRRTDAAGARRMAQRCGVAEPVLDGIPDAAWARPFAVCCASRGPVPLSLHVSAKALAPDEAARDAAIRGLAEQHHGDAGLVDALTAAATAADPDQRWRHSVVGFGFAPDGEVARLNLYFAPA